MMEGIQQWLGVSIVIVPLVFFLIAMAIFIWALKAHKIHLADLLREPDTSYKREGQPGKQTETLENTPVKHSTSRVVLLLTSITSLLLGMCITTYYFYMKIYCIQCGGSIGLDEFKGVVMVLGIGVIPYMVNQLKRIRL